MHYTAAPRAAGVSKYNLRRKMRFALDGLFSFSKAPLRLSAAAGLVALLLGGLIWGYALFGRLFGQQDTVRNLLLGSCHVFLGAVLCALGIVGEYVGRIYDQVRARPNYVVKEYSPAPLADARANLPPSWPDRRASAA